MTGQQRNEVGEGKTVPVFLKGQSSNFFHPIQKSMRVNLPGITLMNYFTALLGKYHEELKTMITPRLYHEDKQLNQI